MPVYEYFCPRCSRELEVLSPIRSAGEYSDCPDCGGKAWRLVSGFGSKTGSYLQPAGMPFRDESGWQLSRGVVLAAVAGSDVDVGSPVGDQQASSAVEMSWLLESQPNGSNIWFVRDWGIASILRYLREDSVVEVIERKPYLDEVAAASPVEGHVDLALGVDQRIEYSGVRPWPDECEVEPAKATEPDSTSADVPMVAYAEPCLDEMVAAEPRECHVDLANRDDQRVESPSAKPWPDERMTEPEMANAPDARPVEEPLVDHAEPKAAYRSRKAAMVTRPKRQATGAAARRWLPTSYFGWFILMVACIAVIVVPLVWVLVA